MRPATTNTGQSPSRLEPISTMAPAGVAIVPAAVSSSKNVEARSADATSDAGPPEPIKASATNAYRAPQSLERSLPRNFVADQRDFFTSPLQLRVQDARWMLPAAVAITALNIADPVIERKLPNGASFIRQSKSFSNYGAAAYAGLVAGGYLFSRATHDDHLRETAVLSGEAAVDTLLIGEGVKYVAGRSRPLEGDGTGSFRVGGSSFPSIHTADAFAIATVVAHEYPGPLTKLLAYGGAAAIGAARMTGRQHFGSDVLVGSALGWYIGRQVYNAHNDQQDRELYGTFERGPRERGPRDPAYMGSPSVPLDSWIYPAIDRLAALGYIDTAFEGMRPWTRMECARLLQEASFKISAMDEDPVGNQIYGALTAEFAFEEHSLDGDRNLGAGIDSVYTRVTGISGPVLTDGYHFGQTLINNYGRPYQEGLNNVTGFSAHAEAGPLAFYIRGEYQHAPSGPALPLSARDTIVTVDQLPLLPPDAGAAAINRMQLLDAYVAANLDNWQISAGKQTLWWGPGDGGPMMLSDNIEPINMVRLSQVSPWKAPGLFRWLGPIRTEAFFGRLSGYQFLYSNGAFIGAYGQALANQPFIHGQKISFKPMRNLEFGFSRTTIYGGPGYPVTSHNILRTLFSTGNTVAGEPNKPGDRRSGLDFSYRLPYLRNWATFYADGFTEDEFSPIAYADRSIWHAGLYISHLPSLPKLDLRAEGVYSDNPIGGAVGPGYFYYNATWKDGYRNAGQLIGSWIGRAGQGAQGWATYHIDAKNFVQLLYRHEKVSRDFLPGGGTLSGFGVRADLWAGSTANLSGVVQYERWTFPVLAPGQQSNVTTSIEFTVHPDRLLKR